MKAEIISLGFLLIFTGIILIMLGAIMSIPKGEAEVKGGGVVLIGPFPIIFGTDSESIKSLIVMTLILILMVYFLFYRRP